jgi:hypothetical protein
MTEHWSEFRVLSFAERFNWTDRELILDSKRTIVIVEVERLCKMIDRNEEVDYFSIFLGFVFRYPASG